MVKTLIASNPKEKRTARKDGSKILNVAENFCDTIQGENFTGVPSTFLRLQGCTLNCIWCDTTEVWRYGNPYSTEEILDLWDREGLIEKFIYGQHLILTGGSPILQQDALIDLIKRYKERFGSIPFIEVENECTVMPKIEMFEYVEYWNNSPKLENSKMDKRLRYKPDILKALKEQDNSYFKFVISKKEDWDEIQRDFLDTGLIYKHQIVIMPEGVTRKELQDKYEFIVDLACEKGVRMSDRLHITIWEKKTGV